MTIISILATLLIILLSLYFLSKVRTDNPGSLFKWMTYLVLLVATGLLVFQLSRSCSKMWHRYNCNGSECSSNYHAKNRFGKSMHGGMHMDAACCGMNSSDHKFDKGMDCCKGMGGRKGMQKRMMESGDDVIRESTVDTIDGKVIIKETEIIKRE